MNPADATTRRQGAAAWHGAAGAGLRAAAIGLAALVLAYVGSLAWPSRPGARWRCRAGWPSRPPGAGVGRSSPAWLQVSSSPCSASACRWPAAVLAPLVLVPAALAAHALLQWAGFDARLDRATDVAALAAGHADGGRVAGRAGDVDLDHGQPSGGPALASLAAGWITLGLGMLGSAVTVLAFDRSVLHALQPGAPWRGSVVAVAVAALTLLLLFVHRAGAVGGGHLGAVPAAGGGDRTGAARPPGHGLEHAAAGGPAGGSSASTRVARHGWRAPMRWPRSPPGWVRRWR